MQPDNTKPYILESDASNIAAGGTVKQIRLDGQEHLVSKHFDSTQQNWTTYERELYAVILLLEFWKWHLFAPLPDKQKNLICTDHKNLEYFLNNKTVNPKHIRWRLKLERFQYNVKLQYLPGKQNVLADALSQKAQDAQASEPITSEYVIPKNMIEDFL